MEVEKAYSRGFNAAVRSGEYEGCKSVPDNPYDSGTSEHSEWEEGFGDGTDFLISS